MFFEVLEKHAYCFTQIGFAFIYLLTKILIVIGLIGLN